jgi:hypothetical protein
MTYFFWDLVSIFPFEELLGAAMAADDGEATHNTKASAWRSAGRMACSGR